MTTTEIDLTYAGRRLTQSGALAYFYSSAEDAENLRGFKKPLVLALKIGTIVRLNQDDDGSYYTGGQLAPRAVGHATDSAHLLTWSAAQEADVAVHAQRSESKRITASGEDPMRAALDPVRLELAGMSSARRAAAIGWIITFLQSGQHR